MKSHRHFLLIYLSCALLAPTLGLADRPADFETRLELYRNGKLAGETMFKLDTNDGRWVMASETKSTRGLTSWIGLKESSTGEGDWHDGRPRPLQYDRHVKAIITMEWSADFDWANGIVRTVYPDGESTLELEPAVVDETALALTIRQGLKNGEDEWVMRLVDEDEIEDAHFRVSDVKAVQTPLGCMRTHVVEKVRGADSKRYTRTYYADEHDFVPVFVEHGKQGDEHVEGRIIALTVDGKPVETGPDCVQ